MHGASHAISSIPFDMPRLSGIPLSDSSKNEISSANTQSVFIHPSSLSDSTAAKIKPPPITLAHFYQPTKLLASKLLAARTSTGYTPRVVSVLAAGRGYWADRSNFETLAEKPKSECFGSMNAYCQTKASNVMTALELLLQAFQRTTRLRVFIRDLLHKGVVPGDLLKAESRGA
ncbi:hypothetical protein R3P38DRAFT_1762470 [Favolaschia claudopus]|uniref:Uncharacterized protein n=1 Tax=Favolaschia claudopus TaxID=2862362 RepID=A0AAW0DCY8_9AGAR